jgi:23S rRNA (cytidine1920-2'-O)/16S rRNA (cytidine1409-2'-O)-methyltransferase
MRPFRSGAEKSARGGRGSGASGRRLDQLLFDRGLVESRERARALILAGKVLVDGRRVEKPGTSVAGDAPVSIESPDHPYVSRGGVKLAAVLAAFPIPVEGCVAADVGASTGGFTDCLLQHGAARVYAVDVGYGQLHARLRSDPRVVLRERTNVRYMRLDDLVGPDGPPVDLVTVDVSFISLTLVLTAVHGFLKPGGWVLALVKPQFEAGRKFVEKGGVVRDPAAIREAVDKVAVKARDLGFGIVGEIPSPIPGPAGNREIFLVLRKDA